MTSSTPLDGAAAVIAHLFREGVLTYSMENLHYVERLTGVPAVRVNEAMVVEVNLGYQTPADVQGVSRRDVPVERSRPTPRPVNPARKYPTPGEMGPEDRKLCSYCGHEHPLAEFHYGRKGKRLSDGSDLFGWSAMGSRCMAAYQRKRYLSLAKEEALADAAVRFEVTEAALGEGVVLVCSGCGQPVRAGQEVEARTELWHAACADARPAPAPAQLTLSTGGP